MHRLEDSNLNWKKIDFHRTHYIPLTLNHLTKTPIHVTGLWSSSFYFGNFLGPTSAGLFVDSIGFRNTSMVFFALYLLMVVVDGAILLKEMARSRREGEGGYEQLE